MIQFLASCVVIGSVLFELVFFPTNRKDDSIWRITSAGVFESLDKVVVRCEFSYQRGIARSRADAEAARFVNGHGEPSNGDMARGLLVKMGDATRFRLIYDTPTDFRLEGSDGFSFASIDFASAKSVFVGYYPKQRNLDGEIVGGTGIVVRDPRMENWYSLRMFATELKYSSLFSPLEVPGVLRGDRLATAIQRSTVLSQDDQGLRFELEDTNAKIQSVNVDLERAFPRFKNVASKYTSTSYSDFEDLSDEVSLAKRVTTIVGPFSENTPEPFWVGYHFRVTSLTNDVAESDFDVTFDANVSQDDAPKTVNVIKLERPEAPDSAFDNARGARNEPPASSEDMRSMIAQFDISTVSSIVAVVLEGLSKPLCDID